MNISIPVQIVYMMSDHVYLANYIYTVYNYYKATICKTENVNFLSNFQFVNY